MSYGPILYGPESEPYNTYAVVTPAPPAAFSGGPIMFRHRHALGKQLVLEDGRKFRFAAAGASTLVIGNMLTAGVLTASQQDLTPAAGAVGDRSVSLTTGASSAVNLFAEGFLQASVTPGIAQTYKIAGHATMTSGAGDLVFLAPGHALREAITTSTRFNLVDNPYFRVIQSPATTVASIPVGVAITAPTTLRACWIQTRGIVGVLGSGTLIAGNSVSTGLGTGGAIGPIADNTQDTSPAGLGWCVFASASGAASPIFITIDG
jgi:hypothetical protein